MELCSEGSLKDHALAHNITEDELWRILSHILIGLRHIHANGFLHLDIKPANIFIAQDLTVKIGDFGIAQRFRRIQGSGEDGGAALGIEVDEFEDGQCTQPLTTTRITTRITTRTLTPAPAPTLSYGTLMGRAIYPTRNGGSVPRPPRCPFEAGSKLPLLLYANICAQFQCDNDVIVHCIPKAIRSIWHPNCSTRNRSSQSLSGLLPTFFPPG